MAKRIKWTIQAEQEFADILEYWVEGNKSNTFGLKLIDLFEEATELILTFPKIGQQNFTLMTDKFEFRSPLGVLGKLGSARTLSQSLPLNLRPF